ncbi:eCIS core domain-containing protein [Cyclobacterium xiamenense]|uniref:eCIS core domain-containing protein n=1 Tax=Cyclobacterium xiamenense TaxID=1297121 RepID=UPI0012B9C036|nr:DUF4157 domain-containing protein [Cyclobacterium xiamenense]
MKRQVYRKSSVGIVNPIFQKRSENSFFSSAPSGTEERISSKEEEQTPEVQLQKQGEEPEDSLQMTQAEEEEQVRSQPEEEMQLQEEEEALQTKEDQPQEKPVKERRADQVEPVLKQEKGRGNPLDSATRQSMEQAFGADFGKVRIHTDHSAQWMNQVMHAKAFAYGNDIFFNDNNYQPGSWDGKKLLAHELTHTLQQKGQKAKQVQGHWSKSEVYQGMDKKRIRAKIQLQFKGAVWNKSSNTSLNTAGLAAAAKNQIEASFQGSIVKNIMGIDVHYEVSTTASLRVIPTLSDLQFGKEHLFVVLDNSHPKVKGTYGRAPFYGSIVYLNERHVPNMISGADANTIPHEVGHTAGLKHLIEKSEEKSTLGAMIKELHAKVNKDNIMWRGGGHPSYSGAEADTKLVTTNESQLDTIDQNIGDKKLNQLDIFGLVDLYSLEK